MADLALTAERQQFLDLARDFSTNEIQPIASAADHSGEFQEKVIAAAWEVGLLNVQLPERFGGLGLGCLDDCVILEEIAAGCSGISAAFEGNEIAVALLLVAGNDEQKRRYLEPFSSSYALAGYMMEDESADLSYRAEGADFILSGKAKVLNGSQAKWFILSAQGPSGKLLFLVESATAGVTSMRCQNILGRKAADVCYVSLRDTRLTAENRLDCHDTTGGLNDKLKAATYPLIAAQAIGVARCALKNALQYSKERTTFGQPISNYQAVNFMMSDMAKDIEAARLLTWKAAWLADNGNPNLVLSTKAKIFSVDMAMKAATDAVQIYGGYGYSREYPVEKLMRDAKMLQIHQTTAHRMKVELGRALTAVHK